MHSDIIKVNNDRMYPFMYNSFTSWRNCIVNEWYSIKLHLINSKYFHLKIGHVDACGVVGPLLAGLRMRKPWSVWFTPIKQNYVSYDIIVWVSFPRSLFVR